MDEEKINNEIQSFLALSNLNQPSTTNNPNTNLCSLVSDLHTIYNEILDLLRHGDTLGLSERIRTDLKTSLVGESLLAALKTALSQNEELRMQLKEFNKNTAELKRQKQANEEMKAIAYEMKVKGEESKQVADIEKKKRINFEVVCAESSASLKRALEKVDLLEKENKEHVGMAEKNMKELQKLRRANEENQAAIKRITLKLVEKTKNFEMVNNELARLIRGGDIKEPTATDDTVVRYVKMKKKLRHAKKQLSDKLEREKNHVEIANKEVNDMKAIVESLKNENSKNKNVCENLICKIEDLVEKNKKYQDEVLALKQNKINSGNILDSPSRNEYFTKDNDKKEYFGTTMPLKDYIREGVDKFTSKDDFKTNLNNKPSDKIYDTSRNNPVNIEQRWKYEQNTQYNVERGNNDRVSHVDNIYNNKETNINNLEQYKTNQYAYKNNMDPILSKNTCNDLKNETKYERKEYKNMTINKDEINEMEKRYDLNEKNDEEIKNYKFDYKNKKTENKMHKDLSLENEEVWKIPGLKNEMDIDDLYQGFKEYMKEEKSLPDYNDDVFYTAHEPNIIVEETPKLETGLNMNYGESPMFDRNKLDTLFSNLKIGESSLDKEKIKRTEEESKNEVSNYKPKSIMGTNNDFKYSELGVKSKENDLLSVKTDSTTTTFKNMMKRTENLKNKFDALEEELKNIKAEGNGEIKLSGVIDIDNDPDFIRR